MVATAGSGRRTLLPPMSDPSSSRGPLAGLPVAYFSRVLAGPCATMLLADRGQGSNLGGSGLESWVGASGAEAGGCGELGVPVENDCVVLVADHHFRAGLGTGLGERFFHADPG
jgi:hypothetical protein